MSEAEIKPKRRARKTVTPEEEAAQMWMQMAEFYPNIAKLIPVAVDTHEGPVVGGACDDQFEFEFALDLVLDGLERLLEREAGEV